MSLTAEDRLAIHELTTRVYLAIDAEDARAWGDCFAEDGAFVAAYGEWHGRAAVQEFMANHIKKGKEAGVRHFLTNFCVTERDDGAQAQFYILKMNVGAAPAIVATAGGTVVVKRVGGQWLFARFQLDIDSGSLASTTTGYSGTGG